MAQPIDEVYNQNNQDRINIDKFNLQVGTARRDAAENQIKLNQGEAQANENALNSGYTGGIASTNVAQNTRTFDKAQQDLDAYTKGINLDVKQFNADQQANVTAKAWAPQLDSLTTEYTNLTSELSSALTEAQGRDRTFNPQGYADSEKKIGDIRARMAKVKSSLATLKQAASPYQENAAMGSIYGNANQAYNNIVENEKNVDSAISSFTNQSSMVGNLIANVAIGYLTGGLLNTVLPTLGSWVTTAFPQGASLVSGINTAFSNVMGKSQDITKLFSNKPMETVMSSIQNNLNTKQNAEFMKDMKIDSVSVDKEGNKSYHYKDQETQVKIDGLNKQLQSGVMQEIATQFPETLKNAGIDTNNWNTVTPDNFDTVAMLIPEFAGKKMIYKEDGTKDIVWDQSSPEYIDYAKNILKVKEEVMRSVAPGNVVSEVTLGSNGEPSPKFSTPQEVQVKKIRENETLSKAAAKSALKGLEPDLKDIAKRVDERTLTVPEALKELKDKVDSTGKDIDFSDAKNKLKDLVTNKNLSKRF